MNKYLDPCLVVNAEKCWHLKAIESFSIPVMFNSTLTLRSRSPFPLYHTYIHTHSHHVNMYVCVRVIMKSESPVGAIKPIGKRENWSVGRGPEHWTLITFQDSVKPWQQGSTKCYKYCSTVCFNPLAIFVREPMLIQDYKVIQHSFKLDFNNLYYISL